jgi:hypothetical protein
MYNKRDNLFFSKVRNLSFDKYLTPAFYLSRPNTVVSLRQNSICFTENGKVIYETTFEEDEPVEALLADVSQLSGLYASITSAFFATDLCRDLVPFVNKDIDSPKQINKRYFYSNARILEFVPLIATAYPNIHQPDTVNPLPAGATFPLSYYLDNLNNDHLAHYTAYHCVFARRVQEFMAKSIDQQMTSEGISSGISGSTDNVISVSIGNIQISSNGGATTDIRKAEKIGSQNTLGDDGSAWYRLQLHLRDTIEQRFMDFSLRPQEMMMGEIILEIGINERTYFDSYPYTLSPFTRQSLWRSSE